MQRDVSPSELPTPWTFPGCGLPSPHFSPQEETDLQSGGVQTLRPGKVLEQRFTKMILRYMKCGLGIRLIKSTPGD